MTAPSLTDFILARVAEDEAVAQRAIQADRPGTHWGWFDPETDSPSRLDGEYESTSLRTIEEYPTRSGVGPLPAFIISEAESDGEQAGALRHIARHDSARVLAECEAKRAIIQRCAMVVESWDVMHGGVGDVAYPDVTRREKNFAFAHLRALAAVYADHADYQQEWAP